MAHRFQSPSSYLKDVTEKSKLIVKGPPAQYYLTTTRSDLVEDGMIRKLTFGQRVLNKPKKTLLIVGETGTGKTALINVMVNYALGVKFEDNLWFNITEETEDAQTSDQTASQTTAITVYEVFGHDSLFSLNIIDTPGFGGTQGAKYDEEIARNLHKLFLNNTGVKEIDAVCLVMKAGMNRLSERQHYIFDALLSLFGKEVENNIVICVTHSDGGPPTNALNAVVKAKTPCRKDSENQPVYLLFNNCQSEKRIPQFHRVYQTSWEQAEDSMNDLFTSLENHNRISTDQTLDVLKNHIQLEASISNLFEQIEFTEKKQNELTQYQNVLNENEGKINNNENFTFTITKSHKEKCQIDAWFFNQATTCVVCEENCHVSCTFVWSALGCKVMNNGHCTVCEKKCHINAHVREDRKYVIKTKTETMTYDQLKEELERNNKSETEFSYDQRKFATMKPIEETMSIMDRLKEEITKNEKKKTELLGKACYTILKLCEIALKTDSAFIMESLDFLIRRKEQDGDDEWVQKLKDLRKTEPEVKTVIQTVRRYIGEKISHFPKLRISLKINEYAFVVESLDFLFSQREEAEDH